ncbi:hypothetical protein [Frankia sp. Cppng1_Ct_nod]|uniref:hypothetical protein n=1 Tax=Frankia sp. Cppng1_Ct_nod TaxID=2897162 RepID=UPI001040ED3A|nr:hypothetical protein [Frankia sp. Cppng1_Ct_nod]
MKRHLSWLIPLVLTIVAFIALAAMGSDDAQRNTQDTGVTLRGIVGLIIVFVFLASLAFTGIYGSRAYRVYRHAHGLYTRGETLVIERDAQLHAALKESWDGARDLLNHLAADNPLHPITIWGLVLHPNENAYLDFTATYSRYYGGDGRYVHVDGFFFGSAPFMAAGYALTAFGNRSRRATAMAEAARRWREHQTTRVIITNQRVICNVAGRWLSFYYAAIGSFYPEPLNWSVVFDFADTAPLRLEGHSGPAIATIVTWALYGRRGLQEHPALEPLRQLPQVVE